MRDERKSIPSMVVRIACAGIIAIFAAPVLAGEAKTECPRVHPQKPSIGLRSGECMPDGESRWSWRPDEVIDHGNNVRTDIDIYRRNADHDPLRKAKIECNYTDRTTLHVPVPGALLRCGIRYYLPNLDKLKPGADSGPQIREVWAISEIDDKPKQPK